MFEVGKTYKNLAKEAGTYVKRINHIYVPGLQNNSTERNIYIPKTITITKVIGKTDDINYNYTDGSFTTKPITMYEAISDKGTGHMVDDDDFIYYELVE